MTSYGKNLSLSIYGGSHDPEIGIRVTGLPAGIEIDREILQAFLKRRAPGQSRFSTQRKEGDVPVFLSGVAGENGTLRTDGQPFHAVIQSTNMRSGDYAKLHDIPRPSHADYPALVKSCGKVDLRGGGHFSGRLTAPLCILGGILKEELRRRGIRIGAHVDAVGNVHDRRFDPVTVSDEDFAAALAGEFPVLDSEAGERMMAEIDRARMESDSVGAAIECAVLGLPVGIGEHLFAGMEGRIASLLFSVPAVKGVEFGVGFDGTRMRGSEYNDPFVTDGVTIRTETNHCGGILGGMTSGMPLIFRAAVKPTPSIAKEQRSVNLASMENVALTIEGRHDPCIAQRIVPVVEAVAAIAVFDALLDDPDDPMEA